MRASLCRLKVELKCCAAPKKCTSGVKERSQRALAVVAITIQCKHCSTTTAACAQLKALLRATPMLMCSAACAQGLPPLLLLRVAFHKHSPPSRQLMAAMPQVALVCGMGWG